MSINVWHASIVFFLMDSSIRIVSPLYSWWLHNGKSVSLAPFEKMTVFPSMTFIVVILFLSESKGISLFRSALISPMVSLAALSNATSVGSPLYFPSTDRALLQREAILSNTKAFLSLNPAHR